MSDIKIFGRQAEIQLMQNWISNTNTGYFIIWGVPGIGKSLLLSEINNIMKSSPKFSGVINNYVYYIRRGTASEHIETYLNKFGDFVEQEFSIKNIKHSNNIKEKTQAYWDSLDDLSEIMKNKNEKTIIIIDGLDEASKDLFQLVPKSNYENILIIVSSRTISRSIDFFQHNILENKKEITLEGLIEDDIITLIDSNFKYKLSLKEKEHIIKVSSGNPLYLNLLSNSINSEKLSNFNLYEIPNEIHEFYENIIKRYNNIDKKYLDFFILLSIVKDYLSSNEVGIFLNIDETTSKEILDNSRELLIFEKDKYNVQLFHESFRDYLLNNFNTKINLIEEEILKVCRNWKKYSKNSSDSKILKYIFMYFVNHLYDKANIIEERNYFPRSINESPLKSEICDLVCNYEYTSNQIEHLGLYDFTLSDSKLALETAIIDTAGDWNMEVANNSIIESSNLETCLKLIRQSEEFGYLSQVDISVAFQLAEDGNIEMAVNRLLIIQDESKLIEALCLILLILWNLDSLNVKDKQLYTKSIFDTIQSKCPTSDAESTLSQREIDDLLGGNEFLELGNIPLLCLFNTPYFIPNNEILKDRISRISDSNLIGFLILTRNNLNVLNSFLEKQREINTIYNYLCEYSYKHMDQESYINIMSIIFQNIDCLKWDNQKIEAYIDLYNSLILNNRKSLIETNIEKFENLLFKIDNSFEKIELLIKLANFYLELKNNFKSKEIVNTAKINILNTKINEKEKKVNNLIDVSKLYLKLDEKENAVKTLNEAEKIVIENIKDTNGDNEKYLLLISEVYFNLENKQKSFQIQNLILDTYNKISQVKKKNTITLYLFKSLMNTFRKEEAKNILNSIVINQSDAIQSINIILNECINHDEMDFIKIFSKSFRNSNYETRNLVTLGEALIKNNIFLLGDEIFDIVINNKLKIEESNFSIEACYDIIFTYLNNNYNIEKAKKYFEVIKQNDFIYNKNTKTNLRLAIMFGNDIEAIELAKKMYSSKNEITQNDFYDSYLDISTDKLKNIKNRKSLIEFGEGLIVNLDKTHPSNKDNKSIFYYRIIEAFLKKKAYKKSREILTELSKKTYYHDLFKFVKDEKIILFLVKFNISLIELDNLDSNDLKNYTFIVIKLLKSSINKKFINKSMKKLDPKLVFEYNEKYSNENIERINFSLRSISKIKYPKRRLELYYSLLRNSTIKIKNSNIVKIYEGCLNAIESLSDDNNKVESLRLLVIIFHDYNKSNYVTFLLDILKTTIEDNEGNGGYDYMEYYIDALSATIGEDEAWNYLESKAKIFLDYYNLKNCRMIIFNSLLEKSQYGKVENYLLLINNEKLKLDLSINLILNELENKNKNFNINFIMKLLQEAEKLMNNYYEDDIIDHKSNLAKIYNKINNSDQCIKTYLFIINELLYSKAQGSKSFYLENLSKEIVRTGNPNIWNIWEENRENINIFTYDQKNILISSYLKEFSYLDNYESLPLLSYLLRALLLLPESDYFLNIKLTLIFKIIIIVDPMKSLTLFENISNFIE